MAGGKYSCLVCQVSEHDYGSPTVVEDIIPLNVRMIMFILLVGVIKVPLDDVLVDCIFFFQL